MTLGRTLNVKKTWNGFTKKCSLNQHACSAYIHVRTLRYAGGRNVHIPAQLNKPKQEGLQYLHQQSKPINGSRDCRILEPDRPEHQQRWSHTNSPLCTTTSNISRDDRTLVLMRLQRGSPHTCANNVKQTVAYMRQKVESAEHQAEASSH